MTLLEAQNRSQWCAMIEAVDYKRLMMVKESYVTTFSFNYIEIKSSLGVLSYFWAKKIMELGSSSSNAFHEL